MVGFGQFELGTLGDTYVFFEARSFMTKTPSTPFLWGASAWLCVALFSACQPRTAVGPLQGYWENEGSSVSISGNSLFFYEREDHWFQTEFTLAPGPDPGHFRATILKDSSEGDDNIGSVVVAVFKIEDGTLTLLALTEGTPPGSIDDDYGSNVLGSYELERAEPREGRTGPPADK